MVKKQFTHKSPIFRDLRFMYKSTVLAFLKLNMYAKRYKLFRNSHNNNDDVYSDSMLRFPQN